MNIFKGLVFSIGITLAGHSADRLPVEDFARLDEYFGMTLSPDGQTLAYIHSVDGEQSIVMHDIAAAKRAEVAMPTSHAPWIPQTVRLGWINNHRLIFGLQEGGFAAINKDGTQVMGLTGRMGAIDRDEYERLLSGGVLHFFRDGENGEVLMTEYDVPVLRYDGSWFAPTHPHVMKLNSRTGSKQRIEDNPGNIEYWLSDPNGSIRVALESKNGIGRTIHRKSTKSKWKPLPGMDWNDTTVRPIAIGSGDILYVKRKSPKGKWAVYPYDLSKMEFGEAVIAHELYDIIPNELSAFSNGISLQKIIFSRNDELLGASYVTEFPRTIWFDPGLAAVQNALNAALPNKINSIVSMSDDRQRLVVQSWSARDPGSFYLFDLKDSSLAKLFSRMPWIDADQMSEVSAVKFKARDGLLIHGYLTLPKGRERKNLPLIVYPHGGPRARDVWGYDPDVQFLANRGYAVLQVNYRGSTGYGESFLRKGRRQVGDKTQHDITDGVRWAIKRGFADPNRIGIMGASFGGYSALMGLAQEPDLYRCGINIAGVTDWIELIKEKADIFPRSYAYNIGLVGNPRKDAEMLKKISPVYLVNSFKAPVLIIHGRDDPAVPYSQARALVKALKKADKPYEFMAKYNEQHGLRDFDNRVEMYQRVDAFLQEYLPVD